MRKTNMRYRISAPLKRMFRMKQLKRYALVISIIIIGMLFTNYKISHQAIGLLFTSVDEIPKNKVGLLLGTVKYLSNGHVNLYYTFRINATVELYKAGKIEFVLVSGDNGKKSYDEPTTFKEDLIVKGIPEDKIFLDYAGFRTLDSVIRAHRVFGQDSVTIISQQFHNERAIYLAKHNNLHAIAYNAQDVSGRYGFKVQLREYLARSKASLDILFNKQPKFLGKTIDIK